MELIIKIVQFFLCFTILVGLHELGHFLMARLFKIRVEKFYYFFDPWFRFSSSGGAIRSTASGGFRWAGT